jgi:hypothetical protein
MAKVYDSWPVSAMRTCRVSVTGLDGVIRSVEVQASSLFEAASAALTDGGTEVMYRCGVARSRCPPAPESPSYLSEKSTV